MTPEHFYFDQPADSAAGEYRDRGQPKPGICDFCSSPDVKWAFPARDFIRTAPLTEKALMTAGMRGGWAACPACHALILRGARDRLAHRSAKRYKRLHPDAASVPLGRIEKHIRGLHDDFWANRQGEPVPATSTSTDPTRS